MTKANPAFAFFSDKRGKAPDTDQDPIASVSVGVGGGGVFLAVASFTLVAADSSVWSFILKGYLRRSWRIVSRGSV